MAGVWIWKNRIAWERGKGKDGGFKEDAKGGSSVRLCAAARARPAAIAPPKKWVSAYSPGLFKSCDCGQLTALTEPAAGIRQHRYSWCLSLCLAGDMDRIDCSQRTLQTFEKPWGRLRH